MELTVGVSSLTGTGAPMFTGVAVAPGPVRLNCTVPDQSFAPDTSTVAESLTELVPSASIGVVPPLTLCCVVTLLPHEPNGPMVKSFSTASVDVDDRVSAMAVVKHASARPSAPRSTPPSKNSLFRAVLAPAPAPLVVLSSNVQGSVVVLWLTMAQASSSTGGGFVPGGTQVALCAASSRRRLLPPQSPSSGLLTIGSPFVPPQVSSHKYAKMSETWPPLVKSLMTRRSRFV